MKRNLIVLLLIVIGLASCTTTTNFAALSSKNIATYDQKDVSNAELLEGEKCAVFVLGIPFGSIAADYAIQDALKKSTKGANTLVDTQVYSSGTVVLGFGNYCTVVKGYGVKI